jgi:chromosome segregation ATPase
MTTETKIEKIEDAIGKLTNISADISKMMAVHEQRINQHDKQVTNLEDIMEKRREESEVKLKDVYETIRKEDRNILDEIQKLRTEAAIQHDKLTSKLADVQKSLWMYMGGLTSIFFLLSYGQNILKLFLKA